ANACFCSPIFRWSIPKCRCFGTLGSSCGCMRLTRRASRSESSSCFANSRRWPLWCRALVTILVILGLPFAVPAAAVGLPWVAVYIAVHATIIAATLLLPAAGKPALRGVMLFVFIGLSLGSWFLVRTMYRRGVVDLSRSSPSQGQQILAWLEKTEQQAVHNRE